MKKLQIVQNDSWLEPFSGIISSRHEKYISRRFNLTNKGKISLSEFASAYLYYGLHKLEKEWVFREYAPNATKIFIVGDFNGWNENEEFELKKIDNGTWEIYLPLEKINHGNKYKLLVYWKDGRGFRIPAFARYAVQDEQSKLFNAEVWEPAVSYIWENKRPEQGIKNPLIYEAHIGMATEEERVGSYNEFRKNVLPHIKSLGYNAVQLMAVQEHPYYGSFGYHVSNFFAPSSRFGTPDELKALVDAAHGMGIAVIMDIVHSHAVKNELEGLGLFDGTENLYFHSGQRREHSAWDSLCFDYGKTNTLHFLLSNCKYWLEEYRFDGFRFDGITSMLYYDHGMGRNFNGYEPYFDGGQDEDALVYLNLANELIHEINPNAITVAEDVSGMPGLASPVDWGGIGFDFRLAMGVPDYWIKIIKDRTDEQWDVSEMFRELTARRYEEKTIGYAESHDQALVGDQTIIFRLLKKEIYWHMCSNDNNFVVDRGMSLHKMIRLATISTAGGGYLNFMGNEFGHPEWIDFPREGNNWSYKFARRQWSLSDDPQLKFKYLQWFDIDMLSLIQGEKVFDDNYCHLRHENTKDQVLAYMRNNLLFVFNFSPFNSYTDYGINVPQGKYKILLNTDNPKYYGNGFVDESQVYYPVTTGMPTNEFPIYLNIYIPCRSALVFRRIPPKGIKG